LATTPITAGGPIEISRHLQQQYLLSAEPEHLFGDGESDTLVAIPLFLFMGYVVERANIVDKLFFSLYMAARNLPGSASRSRRF
jgi:TRAP-type mannitol/chloroaromatic compound transport system permease large subunit